MYDLLRPSNSIRIGLTIRRVSQLFIRPRPRPYKRRLYEAALAPVLQKKLKEEWKHANDPLNVYSASPPHREQLTEKEFNSYELAHVERLREWIRKERFRVMVVCHLNHIKEDAFWMGKNQFRLNGLELCDSPCKILRKLFEKTPYNDLCALLVDDCTCLLFGKNLETIEPAFSLSARFSWIFPIAVTYDHRILTTDHVKVLAEKDATEKLRFQMVQLLGHLSDQIPNSLDRLLNQLPATLDSHLTSHGHSSVC